MKGRFNVCLALVAVFILAQPIVAQTFGATLVFYGDPNVSSVDAVIFIPSRVARAGFVHEDGERYHILQGHRYPYPLEPLEVYGPVAVYALDVARDSEAAAPAASGIHGAFQVFPSVVGLLYGELDPCRG